jgi:hypothetical protein
VSKRTITQRATAIVNEHGPGWWNDYARRHPHSKATTAKLRKDMAIYCVEAALQEAGVTSAEHNTLAGLRDGSLVAVPREMTDAQADAFFTARDATFPRQMHEAKAAGRGWSDLPSVVYAAILAAAKEPAQ